MRILVTGSNGFVGSALCRALLNGRYDITAVVRELNKTEPAPDKLTYRSIGKIDRDTEWSPAIKGADCIIHLAARVHILRDDPKKSLREFRRVNVEGTEHLARRAAAAKVKRFIYVSSIKVNGEGSDVAYTEKDPPAPQEPYAISKWETEQALHQIAAETGLEIVIVRPPLVYGPEVKAHFLQLMKLIKNGMPLPFATIQNSRSLIYIENLVDALIACIDHPKAAGKTYLVSDGEDISIARLIRTLGKDLGRPAKLIPFPNYLLQFAGTLLGQSALLNRLTGSLSLRMDTIQNELSWTPPYTMDYGLKKTAEWFLARSSL